MEVKTPKGIFLSKQCDNNFDSSVTEDNDTMIPREAPPTSTAPTNQADAKTEHVTSAVDQSDSADNNVIAVNNVSSAV